MWNITSRVENSELPQARDTPPGNFHCAGSGGCYWGCRSRSAGSEKEKEVNVQNTGGVKKLNEIFYTSDDIGPDG